MFKQAKLLGWLAVILIAASLACGGTGAAKTIQIKGALPTLTPTAEAAESQAALAMEVTQPSNQAPISSQQSNATSPPATPIRPAQTVNTNQSTTAGALPSPTATPTIINAPPSPTDTPTPIILPAAPSVSPTATDLPQANPTATLPPPRNVPTPSIPPAVDGWTFVGVRTEIDYEDVVVVGELINNTKTPQQEVYISGIFYNKNNQVIMDELETLSYVPVEIIPVGGRVPFELIVESSEPIYRLDLYALSEPSGDPPRQDFQFAKVSNWTSPTNMYCISGQVLNPNELLEDYLVVLATIYNDQGYVASFGEYSALLPVNANSPDSPFELCIDPLEQTIVHHELKALGR